jgi:hypothetical protein
VHVLVSRDPTVGPCSDHSISIHFQDVIVIDYI